MGNAVRVFGLVLLLGAFPRFCFADTGISNVDTGNPDRYNTTFASAPEQAMQSARELVANGDIAGAIRKLKTYVAAHPGEVGPTRLLGDLFYRQGDLRSAELIYRSLVDANPQDRQTYNRLGAVYASQDRVDEAISAYQKSLPGTDATCPLSALHQERGDLSGWLSALQRTADNEPSAAAAQEAAGEADFCLGDYTLAIRYLGRALDDEPRNLPALNYLGLTYTELGDYPHAMAKFRECLRFAGDYYDCSVNLAGAELSSGTIGDASARLQAEISAHPDFPWAYVNLGYYDDMVGNWKGAVAMFVHAVNLLPTVTIAYRDLGVIYGEHRLYELAESALLKGLSIAPHDGMLHYVLGQTYQQQGKRDLALKQYEAVMRSGNAAQREMAKSVIAQLSGNSGH